LIRENADSDKKFERKIMTFLNKASNVIQCGYSEITLEINQLPGKGPIFAKKATKKR
jgi:hypothetical protein